MILVMNKKHGVGCTTLTYNLGRLFNIPIYVDKNNFMLDPEYKYYFPNVSKITASKNNGILDIGTNFKKAYVRKLINKAKVIVIPMDFGHECILNTIETLKYLEAIDRENIDQEMEQYLDRIRTPIVLILNRLDKQDSERDFNYKRELEDRFNDAEIYFNKDTLILTYLRNSYGIYSNLNFGEYFMDKIMSDKWKEKFQEIKENKKWKYNTDIVIKDEGFFCKYYEVKYYNINIEYGYFLKVADMIFSEVDYEDDKIYCQNKDTVMFRNHFSDHFSNRIYRNFYNHNNYYYGYDYNSTNSLSEDEIYNRNYAFKKEKKLIKDMAFISYSIFKHLDIPSPKEHRH